MRQKSKYMTRQEVEKLVGQFGELTYNGIWHTSKMHGYIKEITGDNFIFKQLHGVNMTIPIASLKSFKAKKEPKLIES